MLFIAAAAFTLKCKDSCTIGEEILMGRRSLGRLGGWVVDGERKLEMNTSASEKPKGIYGDS